MKFRHPGTAAMLPPALLSLLPFTSAAQALDEADNARDVSSAIDTIVVTGTQSSIESARIEAAVTPGGVEVVDLDAFRERNASNLASVLLYVPGVWSASPAGDDSVFISSRGSNLDAINYDMNGIKLMQDGLPVTTADGNNHNRIVDPLAARFAIVARGASAMSYGASTLGGAINFETVTAHDQPGTSLSLNGGSFGLAQLRLTSAAVAQKSFDGLVTAEVKNWTGYRDHNEQERIGLYANGGWQISSELALRGYVNWISNNQGLTPPLSVSKWMKARTRQARVR